MKDMEDKTLYNIQNSKGISANLQNYIDSMVEAIVLEGRTFDTQKKYLRKFSENEGLDYERLERGLTELIHTLGKMKALDSESLLKLAIIQAREVYVTETEIISIVQHLSKKELNDRFVDFNVNGVEFRMMKVDGGMFWMGAHNRYRKTGLFSKEPDTTIPNFDANAEKWESPVHQVFLDGYYLCKTEVTQGLWEAVMESEPSAQGGWREILGKGKDYPAYCVSYNEIMNVFLPKLNQMTGQRFRLPTEAEWEYAARGGNKSLGFKYSGSNVLDSVAWHRGNSDNKTHPVRSKLANELGLHDMTGNVWELCCDFYNDYSSSVQHNPQNPEGLSIGSYIIRRGGSWFNRIEDGYFRIACRSGSPPEASDIITGFRLALSI